LEKRTKIETCQLNLWRDMEYAHIRSEYDKRLLVIALKSQHEKDHIRLVWNKQLAKLVTDIKQEEKKGFWAYIIRIISFNYK
jgi:hypothetical protein